MQIGFTGLLGLLFIGLKLAGYITWSWLWVLSPLWIGFAIWLVLVAVAMIFYVWNRTRKKTDAERLSEAFHTLDRAMKR